MALFCRFVIISVLICLFSVHVHADSRFCGEPERYADGRIKRSQAVLSEFVALYPLPDRFNREDYQINHAIPRVCGGCDSVENLIWMHVKAKTCPEEYCQDRHEQLTMCPRRYHK